MDKLITLRVKIESLSKFHQLEILRILKDKNIKYTENRNGIFVNMKELDPDIIERLEEHLEYVTKQQNNLDVVEKRKEQYKQSFFTPLQ